MFMMLVYMTNLSQITDYCY